jgi:hypothetical protein
MAATPSSSAPANYDGEQVISIYSTAVYEATFYRPSTDITIHVGGDDGVNVSVNSPDHNPWQGKDPDGVHVPYGPGIDITVSNPFPENMHAAGTADGYSYGTVPAMLTNVSQSFQKIYDIWNGLKLSWIGDSADAAQQLEGELDQIQRRLFGGKVESQDDQPGVIQQMSSVAAFAASIYSNVEESNTKMFNDFADAITWHPLPDEDADGDGSNSTPPEATNLPYGPITEKFS